MKILDLLPIILIVITSNFNCKPRPDHLFGIVIDSLHFKEIVLGIPINDWEPGKTLKLDSIDLSQTILPATLVGAIVYVKHINYQKPLFLTSAVNDTLLFNPEFSALNIRKVRLHLDINGESHLLTLTNVKVKKWQVEAVRLTQLRNADPNVSRLKELSVQNENSKKNLENLRKLREHLKQDDPLHAALLLDDELAALESRIGEIDDFLKNYQPFSDVDPETIEFKIVDIVETQTAINTIHDILIDHRNAPRALILYFEPAKFDLESIRDKTTLGNYISEIENEIKINSDANHFNIFLTVTAFADSMPVGSRSSLKQKLVDKYGEECLTSVDGYTCWNVMLSKARAEEIKQYLQATIEKKMLALGIKVRFKTEFFGLGLQTPETYNGDCVSKECQDRRIALISRVVEPIATANY